MISPSEISLRLILAAIFGGVIGLERERKDWAAGLRTHMMVCLGAALTMIVSAYGFADVIGNKSVVLDPSRVAAQVISGIGFIGAGTILFVKQGIIRGLTTASGLWTVAAIGLATGGGLYFAALITTLAALIILWVLQPLEKRLSLRFKQKSLRVVTINNNKSASIVNRIFNNDKLNVSSCVFEKNEDEFVLSIRFQNSERADLAELMNILQSDPAIKEVAWGN